MRDLLKTTSLVRGTARPVLQGLGALTGCSCLSTAEQGAGPGPVLGPEGPLGTGAMGTLSILPAACQEKTLVKWVHLGKEAKFSLAHFPPAWAPLPFLLFRPSLEGSVKLKFNALPIFSLHQRQLPNNCHS